MANAPNERSGSSSAASVHCGRHLTAHEPHGSCPGTPEASTAADSRRPHKIGWRSVSTGKLWIVPPGHKPAEYDVGPEWEPIYVLA